MAGHSKWANIQHRKSRQDAKRGKIFTKLIKEITVAARMGGGDILANPRLRLAVDKAKAQSVPKDNIDRAIQRGTGELEGVNYEEIRYEGYGPAGVAIIVDCMTDNRNRTVAEVRHAFSKYNGNLGADGSVAYLFNHVGLLCYPAGSSEEKIMEAALDAGADDVVKNDDGSIDVFCDPNNLDTVEKAMRKAGLAPESSEATLNPTTIASVEGGDAETVFRLLEALEDLDDVQNVYSNADFPDDVLEQMSA